MKRLIHWCTMLAALVTAPVLAQAQGTYPDRPIKFVISFPPGGATDTYFRQLTGELSAALGQPVVIENRGGAGGYIGWMAVANAEPDGYTLMVAENALGISQALYKNHQTGFDPLKQYDAVAAISSVPLVLLASNNVPAKDFAEFVAWTKTLPGSMNYAHAGIGSVSHLVMEVIREASGMKTVGVPYKGGGPAVADVVAGHVSAIVSAMSVGKPLVEGGKVKGMLVTGQERSPALPNVPSIKDVGLKTNLDLEFWWGIFGPKGMPEPVKMKLQNAFETVMKNQAVKERLARVDTTTSFQPGAQLRVKLENEIKNWTAFIDAKNIKPEQQ
jgi:tripartite-type tricarboxylate transporter receptor subunit TctC